ncbi:MAG: two-component system sensor histidine kinase KdpD [Candidatus Levyibacteriota bacterium]
MADDLRARPDPDALLARIEDERARAARGRLKLFFGASPGVGKTYAMLAEARRLREEGRDVVVGLVETHGRQETARLVAGLEVLPRRAVEYRGHLLQEFDIDAALARKPSVLLVDELAHTNAPGSRHAKRYQDVLELLAAGIDVYTTVNVQHLESLNDVIGGITGIRVRETLPDRIFDEADEIVLVDLPADDLLQRLKEGKVYLSEQAEHAIQNYFRKGNLLALRELALRRAADRVDTQMRSFRSTIAGSAVWKARDAILVAIGPGDGNDTVVRSAARLAAALDAPWHAVYVETPELTRLPDARRKRILATLRLAQELGAQPTTIGAPDVLRALVDHARAHNLGKLVVGRAPVRRRLADRIRPSIADRAGALAPDLDVVVITRDDAQPPSAEEPARAHAPLASRWQGYAGALGLCIAVTLIAMPLLHVFDLANIAMLFMLAVVVAALLFGRGPAVLAAVANVLAFDVFFVPPRFSLAVSDAQYLITFAVMLAVGLAIGQLTARLRYQAQLASSGEHRTRRLFDMARELGSALTPEHVAEIGERFAADVQRSKAAVLVMDDHDALVIPDPTPLRPAVDSAVARWCADHGEPAGFGTDTLAAATALYLPLKAPMRTRGVLVVEPGDPRLPMIPEQRRLLETCAALIAISLERVHFVAVAQRTLVDMESERLRNSVLAAISHDLRTPLTALVGLSDALAREIDGGRGADDALALREQATRTAQLVDKLLEMARLQAGRIELHQDWQSLEELVGSALQSLKGALSGRAIDVALPPELPLVRCDGVLIERVIVNLLENAAKHTPPGTPIRIAGSQVDGTVEVAVEDRGPGLPPGREAAIFDMFTRGQPESVVPGIGLGLAICRTIVEAHGGSIRAENREGGGARFVFILPAGTPPAIA